MRKLLIALAATFLATVSAFSGEVEGVVKEIDMDARKIVLENGNSYTLAEDIEIDGIAEGDKVKLTYDDGTTNATAVEKV
ncbi:DUF1344 domain-containing protein [Oricola thermophila]|uniref:DUF1344 domain-containing protein n=1 Tax=Oricola thermophila TaxID=2742145 RepID=A0A6N1V8B8_9HYPH|nr:DUF1344 domain-containing protein [Oricola thermophila]QKV17154.1 DUF1344 domain-containing protein [Oricola thermophila]